MEQQFKEYCNNLIGGIFKILPMKEENNQTLNQYIDSFLVELDGGRQRIEKFDTAPEYLSMTNSIAGLKAVDDIDLFRRKIFECIRICKKLM